MISKYLESALALAEFEFEPGFSLKGRLAGTLTGAASDTRGSSFPSRSYRGILSPTPGKATRVRTIEFHSCSFRPCARQVLIFSLAGTRFIASELGALVTTRSTAMIKPLDGCLVLVVEDEALVALDVAESFKKAGAQVVISRTLEDAMEKAELEGLTAAVIDHALHDGLTTSDVCAKLKERNVPFIVYSGYDKLDGACASGELVPKPASPHMLLTALQGVLRHEHRKEH